MSGADGQNPPEPREVTAPADAMSEFTGHTVNRLFAVGLRLESARSIVGTGPAGDRIAAATDEIDRLIRDIRTTMFGRIEKHRAPLNERLAQTARALSATALNTAELLQRQADYDGRPARLDYPTEIKRWRAFADQAEQLVKRLEQTP